MSAVYRSIDGRAGAPPPTLTAFGRRGRRQAIHGMGLWVFMGVGTTLFSLFLTAYVMRMANADASTIAMPSQLWMSTALLVLGSVALQRAGKAPGDTTRTLLLAGGACAAAFLVVQLWAWQALLGRQVTPVGNPAGSFFYLLTAMHGLHVAGGLVAWALTVRREPVVWRVRLCARYWHFLLAVWLALLASFVWITPDVARAICGTPVSP